MTTQLCPKKREWQLNKLDLATIENEESEVHGEEETEENKRVNDSYPKNSIVKRGDIRKPPASVSISIRLSSKILNIFKFLIFRLGQQDIVEVWARDLARAIEMIIFYQLSCYY